MTIGDWTERFQGTAALPRPVRDRLLDHARIMRFPAGKTVFNPDNIPDSLMFLVDGTIRVSQSSEGGRDIVLYRVEAGDSCVLTTACMLAEGTTFDHGARACPFLHCNPARRVGHCWTARGKRKMMKNAKSGALVHARGVKQCN